MSTGRKDSRLAMIESRMAARGKSLAFSDEEIRDLLDLGYGSKRVFAVLALMFPHVETRNIHHVDHVYPQAKITRRRLVNEGLSEADAQEMVSRRDLLPNLQLLEGPENVAKRDTLPRPWAGQTYPGDAYEAYLQRNELPDLPSNAGEFLAWFDDRAQRLEQRLRRLLQVGGAPDSGEPGERPATRDDELAHSLGE